MQALKSRYRCVRFTLPGFDAAKARRAYSLDELMGFLKELIERHCPGRKAILMLHDWGCAFGYEFTTRNPQMVSKIVGVDIGDPASWRRSCTRREMMTVMAYQVWLALAWAIGGRIGDWMTRAVARLARCPSDTAQISSCMNYPYYMLWFGGSQSYRRQMHRFRPDCPMLFIYGRRKLFMFHAEKWTDELRAREGNQVVGRWLSAAGSSGRPSSPR